MIHYGLLENDKKLQTVDPILQKRDFLDVYLFSILLSLGPKIMIRTLMKRPNMARAQISIVDPSWNLIKIFVKKSEL